MPVPLAPGFHAEVLHDEDGAPIGAVTSGGLRRLAVDAIIGGPVVIGGVELDDGGGGTTRASIKGDAVALSAAPNDGGLLMSGRDAAGLQHHLRTELYDSGAVDETLFGLLTRAAITGRNQSLGAGAQNIPVEARLASGIDSLATGTPNVLFTSAILTGIDSTGADILRPVAARDGAAASDFSNALIAILTNSRIAIRDATAGDWRLLEGDNISAVDGSATTQRAAYTIASVTGIDNTGAAVLRSVEARNFDSDADVASALVSILTTTRLSVLDVTSPATQRRAVGTRDIAAGGAVMGANQHRASGFVASRMGRRFVLTSGGSNLAGTTSFVETTPQVLIDTDGVNDHVIRRIRVKLAVAGGAADVNVQVIADVISRFSVTGTVVVPANENLASAAAASGDNYDENPTALASSAPRIVGDQILENIVGKEVIFDFKDGLIIDPNGSLLIYWLGTVTAPECRYEIEFEDVNVQ